MTLTRILSPPQAPTTTQRAHLPSPRHEPSSGPSEPPSPRLHCRTGNPQSPHAQPPQRPTTLVPVPPPPGHGSPPSTATTASGSTSTTSTTATPMPLNSPPISPTKVSWTAASNPSNRSPSRATFSSSASTPHGPSTAPPPIRLTWAASLRNSPAKASPPSTTSLSAPITSTSTCAPSNNAGEPSISTTPDPVKALWLVVWLQNRPRGLQDAQPSSGSRRSRADGGFRKDGASAFEGCV